MATGRILDILSRDLLHTLRVMRNNPAFAATAVLTLALGIGANTAMFSVVRAVLWKPLAYADPDRLVLLSGGATQTHFEELRAAARSYSAIGEFRGIIENVTLSGGGSFPEVLKEARVSANFLSILGVEPLLGRGFRSAEEEPAGPPVALISAELWRRRFGGNPSIAGHSANFGAAPFTIIGVLPAGFQFPSPGIDVWLTKPSELVRPLSPILSVFARLRPDVNIAQASAELAVLQRQYMKAHPAMLDAKPGTVPRVIPWKDQLVSKVRRLIWMLFGAVGLVLLIACANVAGLLLARATSRAREFAVRAAIGAGRARLMGQLLTEGVLLAGLGGILGVLLAQASLRVIAGTTALNLPRAMEIRLDGLVLGFAVALSISTGILFGLAPALAASRPDLAAALRVSGEATGSTPSTRWFNLRGLLVVGQVALSLLLLIGAALLTESLLRARGFDLGFKPENLLTMQITLAPSRYATDQKKAAFYRELVRRVESLPAVQAATITLTLPLTGFAGTPVQNASEPPLLLNRRPIATIQIVSPSHFHTLEIPLRRGRVFSERDDLAAPLVAIVDESLARRLWPAYPQGPTPVGQSLLIGAGPQPVQIVGIVADIHQTFESSNIWPGVYRPVAQVPQTFAMFAIRTAVKPMRLANAVLAEVAAIDRDQPVTAVKTMDDIIDAELGQRRLTTTLLSLFAMASVLLAAIGLYGILAYSVAQRIRELGIRRALGAQRNDILALILGQAVILTLTGILLGVGGAFVLTRLLKGLLFEVSATDPPTFIRVSLLFLFVALVAVYLPARRALKIDPLAALRN